jgi:hypothetical protein
MNDKSNTVFDKYFELTKKRLGNEEFNDHMKQIRMMILKGCPLGSSETQGSVKYTIISIQKKDTVSYEVRLEQGEKNEKNSINAIYNIEKNTITDYK